MVNLVWALYTSDVSDWAGMSEMAEVILSSTLRTVRPIRAAISASVKPSSLIMKIFLKKESREPSSSVVRTFQKIKSKDVSSDAG